MQVVDVLDLVDEEVGEMKMMKETGDVEDGLWQVVS